MNAKKTARIRRARKTRSRIRRLGVARLSVFRSRLYAREALRNLLARTSKN